ncbi:MAG TPA: T9SS type A sorting domain-containing protein, partial [Parafilimonas sp.]|nr:T9SS type A sorting domain-containing protein [Parafilimonas sp.]
SSINNISNLEAGTYKIILTAGNGCSTDSTVILTEPPTLLASANTDPILCSGGTTNLIATATGGTGNYHYALSNSANNVTGPQDDNQFVVSSGTYVLSVTDDNGCSFATDTIQIDEPPALTATASADIISCNGGTTTLTVTPQGGTGNYHYALSDGTGAQVDNHFTVAAGNYTVTVTDDNGCSFTTDTLRVTEPQALTASASANPILCIGGTTILTVTAQGGTGNYHYTLSDSANNTTGPQDDNHFTVTAGSYTATVTDDNGCLFTAESIKVNDGTNGCGGMVAVNSNQSRSGNITAKNNSGLNASIYPNPSSTAFTLRIQSNDNANVKITIVDVYGRKAYEAEGRGHDTFLFGAEFVPGTYLIKVMQGKNIKILKVIKQSD